jgi:hypothetical protein
MAFHKPDKMLNIALEAEVSKTKLSLSSIFPLPFLQVTLHGLILLQTLSLPLLEI